MEWTDKLKLKKEQLLLLNVPAQLAPIFATYAPQTDNGEVAQAVLFVHNAADLAVHALALLSRLQENAALWIFYPKKSGSIPTDLGRDKGWDAVFKQGYEPVSSIAADEDWTALRFKKKEAIGTYTRGIPMEERQVEGIDFKNRTVTLPADALQAVEKHEGMAAFFNALAFTHKKEYVTAIAEAKKPETRAAWIVKTIAMLQQKMDAKKKG